MGIDGLCAMVCRRIGSNACASQGPEATVDTIPGMREGDRPWSLRLVGCDRIELLVVSLPVTDRAMLRTAGENAADISRNLGYLHSRILPQRRWGRMALVILEDGWPRIEETCSILDCDSTHLIKYGFHAGRDLDRVMDGMPAVTRTWPRPAFHDATWIRRISALGHLGPLSMVDMGVHPGPGMLVLDGPNGTGKTFLLRALDDALAGVGIELELEFDGSDAIPGGPIFLHEVTPVPGGPADPGLVPFRRMLDYGDEHGGLFLPICLEGSSSQTMERLGTALLGAATDPPRGSWPGLVLDNPLAGLDEVRSAKVMDIVACLAMDRQVILTTRSPGEARAWRMAAQDWGVPFNDVNLRGSQALATMATQSSPAPR